MLGVMLLGKVRDPTPIPTPSPPVSSITPPRRPERVHPDACSDEPPLTHLIETSEPEEPNENKPRVALHAPCILKSFYSVAKRYRPSAKWYFVRDPDSVKVEIKHENEAPLLMTSAIDNETIVTFLTENILPFYGELTAGTHEWFLSSFKGLIWTLFDMDEEGKDAVVKKHRPVMEEVYSILQDRYYVAWIDTLANKNWIETWLTITPYPAIVVQREAGDLHRYTYTGEMTVAAIVQFVNDVDNLIVEPDRHDAPSLDGLMVPSEDPRLVCMEPKPRWHRHPKPAHDAGDVSCMTAKLGKSRR